MADDIANVLTGFVQPDPTDLSPEANLQRRTAKPPKNQRTITVRMTREEHRKLLDASHEAKVSMNKFVMSCLDTVLLGIPDDPVRTNP
jgi:hypothetical protein